MSSRGRTPYFGCRILHALVHRADFLTDTMGGQRRIFELDIGVRINLNQSMNQQRVIVAAVLALEKWLRG